MKGLAYVLLAISLIVGLVSVIGCGGSEIKSSAPDDIAIEVLGTPEGDEDSGVISANYDGLKLEVEYQFFPLGMFSLEKEASYDLVSMFKKVFEKTRAGEIVVRVLGPFKDKYGNYTWEHVLTLGITRASFDRINWEHMADTEFYKACDTYWKLPGLD